ncbi:MAG: DUF5916 domain-containing protein [Vicinamibacterales bacterium]
MEAQTIEQTVSTERRTVTAVRLEDNEEITLDGLFDEPVWARAIPATDFVQQDPDNGAPPTERTEVRFAVSREALYMAVTNFDSEPDRLLGNTMKRDEFLRADDRFMWVIDPFLNGQGGYFFEMNPSGLMADSQMGPTGPVNREWDGIWDSYTRQSEIGWTIEIRIPFRTISFDPEAPGWGINFQRTVRRKNEESLWMGWAYNQGLFRIQNSGLLLGVRDVEQGLGLDLRPYVTMVGASAPGRGQPDFDGDPDVGLDVYYTPTPTLRANLTLNTDFAQTEVDQRQVNLTRFSLFFPERRGFFLEGASFFDFISASQRSNAAGRSANETAVVPFFSRRIGLDANGQPQPIDIGAKLTGQIGANDIGVLQIRTGEEGVFEAENFTVARLKRRMFRQSYIGGLLTHRDGADDFKGTTVGLDYRFATNTFLTSQNLETTGYVLRTDSPTTTADQYAYGLSVDYPNDRYLAGLSYREIQEQYDPAVGFTLRTGYRRYGPQFKFQPRPSGSIVRQYFFGVDGDIQYDTKGNDLLLRAWDYTVFRAMLQTQDQIEAHVITNRERLDAPFPLSNDIVLPAGGTYDFNRFRVQVQSSNSRLLAATGIVDVGDFYSGTRQQLTLNLAVRPRPGLVVYLDAERNRVELPEGELTTRLYRAIVDTQFSPWIAFTSNLQYDSVSEVLGWQARFRWIITPGSDLYLVYTHNWQEDLLSRFQTMDKRIASKLLYTIGL